MGDCGCVTTLVWDLQKKKIKRKHQLARPTDVELDKLMLQYEEAYAELEGKEDQEDEKDTQGTLGLAPETVEKLFRVRKPRAGLGRQGAEPGSLGILFCGENHIHRLRGRTDLHVQPQSKSHQQQLKNGRAGKGKAPCSDTKRVSICS